MRLILVQTGSTLPAIAAVKGDFDAMFRRGLFGDGDGEDVVLVDPRKGDALPDPSDADAVLVTGSASMVTNREPWSERTKDWIPSVLDADVPFLAVCYGHQLLAEAAGGKVGKNPRGREIGTIAVTLTDAGQQDRLLGALDERPVLSMQSTHVESVLELPEGATLLGHTPLDPHQAFRVGERAWGVQFHPEIDADVSRAYVTGRADAIRAEGLDPEALAAAVRDTPAGTDLLRRFAALVREGV